MLKLNSKFKFTPKSYYENGIATIGNLSIRSGNLSTNFVVMFIKRNDISQFYYVFTPKRDCNKDGIEYNGNVWFGLFDKQTVFDFVDYNREEVLGVEKEKFSYGLSKDQIDYLFMTSDIYPVETSKERLGCPLSEFNLIVKELFNICLYARSFHKGNLFVDRLNYNHYTQDYIRDEYFDNLVEDFNKGFG